MSLKYRNASGVETPVAGLNGTSGELVPSVALKQSGTVNFSCNADSWTTVDVTFTTPMPDTDYLVNTDSGETAYVHVQVATVKHATGFTMIIWNRDAVSGTGIIRWTAFKLMTDEVHEADAAAIAALQEVVPSNAAASNKLVPASDTFVTYTPNTDDYSTWAEFLELLHQKGAGLWCGRAYLANQWWYYTASIQFGAQGYWLGSGTFKSVDNANLKGVNKSYSTSTTWNIVNYIPDTALTSSITSGSTAPVTSGGVFKGSALAFRGNTNDGYVTVMGQGLYLVTVDRHGTTAGLGVWIVAVYDTSSIEATPLSSTFGNVTFSWDSTTKQITASGETNVSVNAVYIGAYY